MTTVTNEINNEVQAPVTPKEKQYHGRIAALAGVAAMTGFDVACNGVNVGTAVGIATGGLVGYSVGNSVDDLIVETDEDKTVNLIWSFVSGVSATMTGQNIAYGIAARLQNKDEDETEVSLPSEVAEVINQFAL